MKRVKSCWEGLADEDRATYSQNMCKPLLKLFEDKRDTHRETAAILVREMLKELDFTCLEWVLPVVVARLANEAGEDAEHVQLELVELCNESLRVFAHDIARRGFTDYYSQILKRCLKLGDPEMKRLCCKTIDLLCAACREHTKPVAMEIAKVLKPNLRVKQFKVRADSITAFGKLLCNGGVCTKKVRSA